MKRMALIGRLFFGFRGRISLKIWWLAKFVVLLVIILLWMLIHRVSAFYWLRQFVVIVSVPCVLWSWYVLDIKRLHDRSRMGWWVLLVYMCLNGMTYFHVIPGFSLIYFAGFIYPAVQIAFLPGNAGENRYGPPEEFLKAWRELNDV